MYSKINSHIKESGIYIEENCLDFRISRHIFRWGSSNICLARAYCYPLKTIVVISQICGELPNDKEWTREIILKLNLNRNRVIWITHKSFFENDYLINEKFYKSLIKLNYVNSYLDKVDFWKISDKEEISLHNVEELIECKLETIETWLNIDTQFYQDKELKERNKLEKLLRLYLEPKLEEFILEFERLESIMKKVEYNSSKYREPILPVRGALFFYPKTQSEYSIKRTLFLKQQELMRAYKPYELSALPYVSNYDYETEVVICICLNNEQTVCSTFPRINVCKSM